MFSTYLGFPWLLIILPVLNKGFFWLDDFLIVGVVLCKDFTTLIDSWKILIRV